MIVRVCWKRRKAEIIVQSRLNVKKGTGCSRVTSRKREYVGRSLKDAIKHVYSCKCVNYYATFEMVRVNILFVLALNRIRSSYKLPHLLQAQVSDIFGYFEIQISIEGKDYYSL